jgi:energy-coupling factor transport system permease protein
MDPRTRLFLLGAVGALAICLDRPGSLGALCVLSASPLLVLRLDRRWLVRGGLAVAAVVWGTVLSQAIFFRDLPRIPLLRLGPITLWREGIFWGLVQSLRFVAPLLAGVALAVSTPPDRLHAALVRLRVPFPLAFLAVTALRAVPETGSAMVEVRQARARRGRPAWRRSPLAWLRLEVSMLRPTVAEALRRARALAETLDARGFDATAPRGVGRPLRLAGWERGLLAVVGAAVLATVGARILFLLYAAELLYLPALRPLYGFVRAWL